MGVVAILLLCAFSRFSTANDKKSSEPFKEPSTLRELLALAPSQLEKCDIGRMNLLCAEGLPGAERLNVSDDLAALDTWVSQMRPYIESSFDEFQRNREKFKNNENYYRMMALITFVQRGKHAVYNSSLDPVNASMEEFFKDSKDLFIHGLVDEPHLGTCSSMPVLYVALGRRLGYPLKLVTTKRHLFARWESPDGKGSFNIEGTNHGMNSHDYEYYKKWPVELSETDLASGEYLHPLSPSEELAMFLSTRGICLQVNGHLREAKEAFSHGASIAPSMKSCNRLANQKTLNQ